MNAGLATLVLFGSLLLFLALGSPLVFSLGGIAVIGLYLMLGGERAIPLLYFNIVDKPGSIFYITIPLFIFMAYMLECSGAAEKLYGVLGYFAGRLPGSLAMGTVVVSVVLAAMTGMSSTSIVTMGVTVLPSMLNQGYSKHLSIGCITAGSTLGILIPPSALGLLYAVTAGVSFGKLFLAGFIPGLLIAVLFILYIGLLCRFKPALGPPSPRNTSLEYKGRYGWFFFLVLPVFLPALLVVFVLGSIFAGIATPTEAAAVGAVGATIVAALNHKLTWKNFTEVNFRTLELTGMVMWVLIGASAFRALYVLSGAIDVIQNILLTIPFGAWGTLVVIQLVLLVLGAFLDEFGILIITVPTFLPVMKSLGLDPVWFGILFIINMEIAELTPPVGMNLFYIKGIAPEGTSMSDIYRSVTPFILLIGLALLLVMIFPQIALWLPNTFIK